MLHLNRTFLEHTIFIDDKTQLNTYTYLTKPVYTGQSIKTTDCYDMSKRLQFKDGHSRNLSLNASILHQIDTNGFD